MCVLQITRYIKKVINSLRMKYIMHTLFDFTRQKKSFIVMFNIQVLNVSNGTMDVIGTELQYGVRKLSLPVTRSGCSSNKPYGRRSLFLLSLSREHTFICLFASVQFVETCFLLENRRFIFVHVYVHVMTTTMTRHRVFFERFRFHVSPKDN